MTRCLGADVNSVRACVVTTLGDDAARVAFTIGANAADADVRGTAWYLLTGVRDASFTRTLLEDLERHPSDDVRARAVLP